VVADDPARPEFSAAKAPEGPESVSTGSHSTMQSGIDLAKALLATARKDAAVRTGRAVERRALRSGDVSGQRRSGAGADDRDPQPLGRSLERLVSERGWDSDLAAGTVVASWERVVGPAVAEHCSPERFAGTELTVRADSSAWATQLRLLAPTLVAKLNEACGHGSLSRLTVLGPSRPSWRKGPLHVRGRGPRDTFG
jgi:predicted nucleic acid-binding Zn ribbon protein